jgi:hypothetical protein
MRVHPRMEGTVRRGMTLWQGACTAVLGSGSRPLLVPERSAMLPRGSHTLPIAQWPAWRRWWRRIAGHAKLVRHVLTPGLRAPRWSGADPARERLRRGLTRDPGETDADGASWHLNADSAAGDPDGDRPGSLHRDRPGKRRHPDGRGITARDLRSVSEHPDARAPECRNAHRREPDGLTQA